MKEGDNEVDEVTFPLIAGFEQVLCATEVLLDT